MPAPINRRRFLLAIAALPAAGIGGGAYTKWLEPGWLEVTRKQVPIDGLERPLRLAHLSDFHASPQVGYDLIGRAIDLALDQKPDLIAITGDFITWEISGRDRYVSLLRKLAEAAPSFACLGNHDGGRWAGRTKGYADSSHVVSLLDAGGVRFLFNERSPERIAGCTVDLIGLGDLWSGDCRPELIAGFRRRKRPAIVLSHNPDSKERLRPYPWDLLLCGHTHGGQLIVPLTGQRPFLPVKDKRFAEGLISWEGRWIHVTRGVGNLHGMRFNCRPEVSLLDLTPARHAK